ncbi:MAG: NAD(P)H-dependent oxidoreductase [Synergistaceae bacterium]|nr:NAD(P)H-dependent oxidoreductase [Synergistaceae bacterium]MBQ6665218.1 NAD(P)H-dependent oxidoreductase [Synergistaceae bacterium]
MSKILVVSGHTDLKENSFANKIILSRLEEIMPEAEYVYLDSEYPDWKFDVEREQNRLRNADVIVMQFPFFWYGVPSLMHKWMEEVFVHGFSHGSKGKALVGKKLVVSFTSGAPEEMYQAGGIQGYPVDDFLIPLKQFAAACGMVWAGYVYSGGLSYASRHDDEKLRQMKEKALLHAERVAEKVKSL